MITLVTGGSGSGKSAFAENQLVSCSTGSRIYIATMYPFDEESHRRIARHRDMRAGKDFETIERYTNLKELSVPEDSYVLLECMSNLVANEMFQEDGAGENTVAAVLEGVKAMEARVRHLFIVTNEIFSDGVEYDPETERYQRYLGVINQEIGKIASQVAEVVYGIPIWRKVYDKRGKD